MGRIDASVGMAVLTIQSRIGVHPWTEATALNLMSGGRRGIIVDIAIRPYCAVTIAIVTSTIARRALLIIVPCQIRINR